MKERKGQIIVVWLFAALLGTEGGFCQGFLTFPTDYSPTTKPVCDFICYPSHGANDYPVADGTNVYASASGWATAHYYPNTNGNGNYGSMITIIHNNGYETRYAHLSSYATQIKNDQARVWVEQGVIIGYSGHSGGDWKQADGSYRSPPHLHFEVGINGTDVDPYNPSNYLWTTNPPSFAPPSLVGLFSDGWHSDGTSQAVVNCYNDILANLRQQNSGATLTPYDRGQGVYVHLRTLTYGSKTLNVYVQDFKDNANVVWCVAYNPNDRTAYSLHGQILAWWHVHGAEVGYPMGNEFYGDYAGDVNGGAVGSKGNLLTIQLFDYLKTGDGFPAKTVCYNNNTGQLGHYPVGRFQIGSPEGKQYYFCRTNNVTLIDHWPKLGKFTPTGIWWTDVGNYNFFWMENGVKKNVLTHDVLEGNSQLYDPVDPPPAPPSDTFTLSQALTCKAVNPNYPYDYVSQSTEFTDATDSKICCWLEFTHVTKSLNVRWRWLRPDGSQMGEHIENTTSPQSSGYDYWGWYRTSAWSEILWHLTPGQCSVEVYVDGVLQRTLNFNLTITKHPIMSVAPTSLDFGETETQKTITISNIGPVGSLAWFASENPDVQWMTISPASSSVGPGQSAILTVNIDRSSLADGSYSGAIRILPPYGNPNYGSGNIVVNAIKNTTPPPPDPDPTPDPEPPITGAPILYFPNDGFGFGEYTQRREFDLENRGSGTLFWAVSSEKPFVIITPDSGNLAAGLKTTLTFESKRLGLGNDTYPTNVYFTSNGGNKTIIVCVTNKIMSGVAEDQIKPAKFILHPPFPNPFNPATTISYDLPEPAHVKLIIYDLGGREVDRLIDATKPAGQYSILWQPIGLPSGTYFCRLSAGSQTKIQKIIYVK